MPHCAGPGHADRGLLFVYRANAVGVKMPRDVTDFETLSAEGGTGRFGFDIEWPVIGTNAFDVGSYSVAAP